MLRRSIFAEILTHNLDGEAIADNWKAEAGKHFLNTRTHSVTKCVLIYEEKSRTQIETTNYRIMKTLEEFLTWLKQHYNERWWNALEQLSDNDKDIAYKWRDSILNNTDPSQFLNSCGEVSHLYNCSCKLFGKEQFDKDITQSFNDNL